MTSSPDLQLRDLRERWRGSWRIWRGRRTGEFGDKRTGDYVASRLDPAAGVEPTVIRSTPEALDEALQAQREAVMDGRTQMGVDAPLRAGE